ncbi:hypothetical protein [Zooshikella ganghwensis]|uniref:Uncharacterized protein n=1 Tax=Zooshikella ganghwensis TaxID=202772 RepID=A0A4P9VLJ0_9GAMM|nr:hypothetical protein [Zooshikella ganghwensis]RDH42722.1 hypothetical protein B9G39_04250 [Zooshikella ganghwensis]
MGITLLPLIKNEMSMHQLKTKLSTLLTCLFITFTSHTFATQTSTSIDNKKLRPLLNSERIELEFGSYGIDVLESGESIRVSRLYSTHSSKKVTRTLAIVHYPEQVDTSFANEHKKILNGGSIGAVLKAAGWKISKQPQFFGELKSDQDLAALYKSFQSSSKENLAIHIYSLYIEKNNTKFKYATIAEVHHPDYLTLNDLKEIYSTDYNNFNTETEEVKKLIAFIQNKIKSVKIPTT